MNGCANRLRVIRVAQGQAGRQGGRRPPFGEGGVARRNDWRIGGWCNRDGAGELNRFCRRVVGTRIKGIGAVVERDGKDSRCVGVVDRRVVVTCVAVAQAPQQSLHCSGRSGC